MDFWLIQNGEKAGPFHDYEIRARIENGNLGPDEPAWGEGMSEWRPLREISVFRSAFERPAPSPPPLPAIPRPPSLALGRRLFARFFDIQLFYALCLLGVWSTGGNLVPLVLDHWVFVGCLLGYVVLEAIMIRAFGATPGKALLGLRVLNRDGSKLGWLESFRRSFLAISVGVGFGHPILVVICLIFHRIAIRATGSVFWDALGNHQVQARQLWGWRVAPFVLLFFLVSEVRGRIAVPVMMENLPEVREMMPKWLMDAYEKELAPKAPKP